MAKQTLGERLIEVLAEGGPRKPNILRALAEHLGQGDKFDAAIAELKQAKRIHIVYRNGGPHYRLNPKAG